MLLPASEPLGEFDARPLFWQVRHSLLELLGSLEPGEWEAPTVAQPWAVRDVVAHLVGDDLGRLSRSRDGHLVDGPANGETLAQFLDRHNAQWVAASQRLSPVILTELLAMTSHRIWEFWDAVDLSAVGEPVSWAGPEPAPVWLDCARDFTEDWVHQQQIRDAVDRPGSDSPVQLGAVVDTFMHAIPHTLQDHAPQSTTEGTSIRIVVEDDSTTEGWSWMKAGNSWLPSDPPSDSATTLTCSADTWWRLCVRMITPAQARQHTRVTGDQQLANAALQIIAIIREP